MIRDLLIISNEVLDLREDADKGIHVAGLSQIEVDSPQEIMDLLFFGNNNRTQEATGANATSSRSHAVLEIEIDKKDTVDVEEDINIGKLSMIDLAGSERAARTHNRGIRMIEGANINRSLLSLGNCINALVRNMKKGGKKNHIPYRDSKLTRLLKNSLGGNSRTVMIANISPSDLCYEDTNNTLKYANRAKDIKTTVTKNVKHVEHHISEYTKIIGELKDEITDLKHRLSYNPPAMKMITTGQGEDFADRPVEDNDEELEEFLDKLSTHFTEETKIVKRIDELQNKHSLCKLSTANTKIILEQNKQRFGEDHERTRQVEVELEVLRKNDIDFQEKLKVCSKAIEDIKQQREQLREEWRQSDTMTEQSKKLLDLQFTQHSHIIDKITLEHQSNSDEDWSRKMNQLRDMDEQIFIRDQLIQEAGQKLKQMHSASLFQNSLLVKDPYGI